MEIKQKKQTPEYASKDYLSDFQMNKVFLSLKAMKENHKGKNENLHKITSLFKKRKSGENPGPRNRQRDVTCNIY